MCGSSLDLCRSAARVVSGKVVLFCGDCSTGDIDEHPQLRESTIELAAFGLSSSTPGASGQRRKRRLRGGWKTMAIAAGVLALLVIVATRHEPPARNGAAIVDKPAKVRPRIVLDEPTWSVLATIPQLKEGQWVHPVAGSEQVLPLVHSRKFGAERPGNRPRHCRRGHCGVDLIAARGTPIVAIRDGIVTRIERSRYRRSGRYVSVTHDDGSVSSYMHLDRIAPGLEKNQEIVAGSMLGTLGRTGIRRSNPHLHFQVEVPRGKYHRFIDPAPKLASAVVIGVLEIELPTEPPELLAEADAAEPEVEDELFFEEISVR